MPAGASASFSRLRAARMPPLLCIRATLALAGVRGRLALAAPSPAPAGVIAVSPSARAGAPVRRAPSSIFPTSREEPSSARARAAPAARPAGALPRDQEVAADLAGRRVDHHLAAVARVLADDPHPAEPGPLHPDDLEPLGADLRNDVVDRVRPRPRRRRRRPRPRPAAAETSCGSSIPLRPVGREDATPTRDPSWKRLRPAGEFHPDRPCTFHSREPLTRCNRCLPVGQNRDLLRLPATAPHPKLSTRRSQEQESRKFARLGDWPEV